MEIDSGAAAGPVLGPAQHRVMRAVASAVSTLAAEDTCKAVMEQNRRNALVGAVRWRWCGCSGGIGWLFLKAAAGRACRPQQRSLAMIATNNCILSAGAILPELKRMQCWARPPHPLPASLPARQQPISTHANAASGFAC